MINEVLIVVDVLQTVRKIAKFEVLHLTIIVYRVVGQALYS